jgi:hypothetical protein
VIGLLRALADRVRVLATGRALKLIAANTLGPARPKE